MSDPRQLSTEEVRYLFLKHIRDMVAYWEKVTTKEQPNMTVHQRLEGLAFSILTTIDGSSAELPKFILAPDPHPSDREYHTDEGENWFPENHLISHLIQCDLSGGLHEMLHRIARPASLDHVLTPGADFVVKMPPCGETIKEVKILKWNVKVGDQVYIGTELAELETEKATLGLFATVAGHVSAVNFVDGILVPVGAPICYITIGEVPAPTRPASTRFDRDVDVGG